MHILEPSFHFKDLLVSMDTLSFTGIFVHCWIIGAIKFLDSVLAHHALLDCRRLVTKNRVTYPNSSAPYKCT